VGRSTGGINVIIMKENTGIPRENHAREDDLPVLDRQEDVTMIHIHTLIHHHKTVVANMTAERYNRNLPKNRWK
jgi:hypothetical protein